MSATPPQSDQQAAAKLVRGLLLGLAAAVVIYTAYVLWVDAEGLAQAWARIPASLLLAACGLSFLNYLVRFVRWQLYLSWLDLHLPWGVSFRIHLAGLALTVSPGKMGETIKSWLLLRRCGAPIARTAPIVVAERVTDLLGFLVLLVLSGSSMLGAAQWMAWTTLGLIGLLLMGLYWRGLQEAVLRRAVQWRRLAPVATAVQSSLEASRLVLAPRRLVVPVLLAALGWFCECLGFYLLAQTFGPVDVATSVTIFALGALVGALAFLAPGGLGVTEASMTALLQHRLSELGVHTAASAAAATTLAARLCTLWFAVALGWVALVWERRSKV